MDEDEGKSTGRREGEALSRNRVWQGRHLVKSELLNDLSVEELCRTTQNV